MIEILGKYDCKSCNEVKMLLDLLGEDYEYFDVTVRGCPIASELKRMLVAAGSSEIPALFVDGVLVKAGEGAVDYVVEEYGEQ